MQTIIIAIITAVCTLIGASVPLVALTLQGRAKDRRDAEERRHYRQIDSLVAELLVHYEKEGDLYGRARDLDALRNALTALNLPDIGDASTPPRANLPHLRPEAADRIDSDEHLKNEWRSVHVDIQRIYEVLGPPPLKTLTGSRDDR
jgi:hypothetical protein